MLSDVKIECPKCGWEPDESCRWICSVCNTKWNTFETRGQCPTCEKSYQDTACMRNKGGCGAMSPHADWYVQYQVPETVPLLQKLQFWKKRYRPSVTERDKKWIESSLLSLTDILDPIYFQSLSTIIPDDLYSGRVFTGTEEDAFFIFNKIVAVMNIDAWELHLMFYSTHTTTLGDSITTPSEDLSGNWKSTVSKRVDNGLGNKEIWIEMDLLKDIDCLTATVAYELARYKLVSEYGVEQVDKYLTAMLALAFGFGIFMGNSYFRFTKWKGDWYMSTTGHFPDQVTAYAMAWLAHYRNEDISWNRYLTKTMNKYFEQSYNYLGQVKKV